MNQAFAALTKNHFDYDWLFLNTAGNEQYSNSALISTLSYLDTNATLHDCERSDQCGERTLDMCPKGNHGTRHDSPSDNRDLRRRRALNCCWEVHSGYPARAILRPFLTERTSCLSDQLPWGYVFHYKLSYAIKAKLSFCCQTISFKLAQSLWTLFHVQPLKVVLHLQ